MPWPCANLSEAELISWIQHRISDQSHIFFRGYQGHIYLFEGKGCRLIIKVASGSGLLRALRTMMLRNEYKIYARLASFRGSPRCYGLLQGRYLVLEYIEAVPLRHAEIEDRDTFFQNLLDRIIELHLLGIVHFDLKRKDNLLVADKRSPCLIDFGTAVARKLGFAPINHYLYNLGKKFDFNAWIKLKYDGKMENISAADRIYYQRTRLEKTARWVKRLYKKIRFPQYFP